MDKSNELNAMHGPLHGIRVLDLTTILLGPYATQILADMGADVIKIEAPVGDATRELGPPPLDGMGSMFMNLNRNKRGLVLDLKSGAGKQAMLRLLQSADVFVHNMRPQAIERLGLDYESLRVLQPKLIYCGAYGFRQSGPYGNKPAYDDIIQAASGMAQLQSKDGVPQYITSSICDKITAQALSHAVTLALFHRERFDEGQNVSVTMFEHMTAFNMAEHLYGQTYIPPRTVAGYTRTLAPNRRPFRTADGYMGVLPYNDKQWRSIFESVGREELIDDERFCNLPARHRNVDQLYEILADILATRTTAAWLDVLDAGNVPAMAVLSGEDLIADEHLRAIGFWHEREDPQLGTLRLPDISMHFSQTPGGIRRIAPRLGEHSVEILSETGLSQHEIDALISANVTIDGSRPS